MNALPTIRRVTTASPVPRGSGGEESGSAQHRASLWFDKCGLSNFSRQPAITQGDLRPNAALIHSLTSIGASMPSGSLHQRPSESSVDCLVQRRKVRVLLTVC
jgi:hypothetical protein